MKPTIGRTVHFYSTDQPMAAVITGIDGDFCLLFVMLPPPSGESGRPERHVDVRARFSEVPAPGCWSWPRPEQQLLLDIVASPLADVLADPSRAGDLQEELYQVTVRRRQLSELLRRHMEAVPCNHQRVAAMHVQARGLEMQESGIRQRLALL